MFNNLTLTLTMFNNLTLTLPMFNNLTLTMFAYCKHKEYIFSKYISTNTSF